MEEKKQLRKSVRERLRAMTDSEKKEQSLQLLSSLEQDPTFIEAQTVLLFWSLPDEVQTHTFVEKWSQSKDILLPVVIGDDTVIRRFEGVASMQTGAFNIEEPTGEDFTEYDLIDLVVVPGMAFDPQHNRLGRGKGYYDKLLKKINAPTIGICYPCQYLPAIPHESWDVKMNKIIFS